jgi:hypothetical protein
MSINICEHSLDEESVIFMVKGLPLKVNTGGLQLNVMAMVPVNVHVS